MIKVNLLQNTVERTPVDAVETAISAKGTQQVLLMLIALGACVLASVVDYVITVRENTRLNKDVKTEEALAQTLQALNKQAAELQAKNKAVEDRINAIQRLRAEQIGPVRLLQLVDTRMPSEPNFRLKSIKQENDTTVAINGYSPSEAQVTAFAKNLEFSNGLFTNFHVETHRVPNPETARMSGNNVDKYGSQVVEFVIRCSYNPETLLTHGGETKETKEAAPAAPPTATPAKESTPAAAKGKGK
jgi:Tfp pilus assembly protein PilN